MGPARARVPVAARAVVGRCTSARQLHRQPLRGGRRLGRPALRQVRRRPRRDPDVPDPEVGERERLAPQLLLRVDGRRSPLRLLDSRSRPSGAGGLPTLQSRRGLRAPPRPSGRARSTRRLQAGSAGARSSSAASNGADGDPVERAGSERRSELRRLPSEPPARAAGGRPRRRRRRAGQRARHAAAARSCRRDPHRRRLRGARVA